MPIKTLHITNAFHQTSGGISTFYRSLLKAANRLGRDMTLVVPSDRTRIEKSGEFSRIYYVEAPQAPFFDRRYRLLMPQTYLPGLSGKLKQILQDEKPDLVEICDKYSTSWLAGLLRRGWLLGLARPVLAGQRREMPCLYDLLILPVWIENGTL